MLNSSSFSTTNIPFPSAYNPSIPEEFPAYHPGMVEVKFRTDSGPVAAAMAMGAGLVMTRAIASGSPGTGVLLAFERAGLIRKVTSLVDSSLMSMASAETPMLSALSASVSPSLPNDPNTGVNLVELYDDASTESLVTQLSQDPSVESVSRVPIRYLLAKKASKRASAGGPAVPAAAAPPANTLWNLDRIRWAQARLKPGFKDANQIKVAVLDTGIDSAHPDLGSSIVLYDYTHPTDPNISSSRDIIGHGTHVAGTITATINNAVGINGICRCKLHALKIFDDTPDWWPAQGYFAYFVNPVMYAKALAKCVSLGIQVINLSIGGRGAPSANEASLFRSLIQNGTTVVAAMGNSNSSILEYPAAIPGVIAVGATSINDTRATFSNYGSHINLCAPGVGIWSTIPTYAGNSGYQARPTFPPTPDFSRQIPRDVDYANWQGTSMASPHVAGAVALLLANKGPMTPAQVAQKLMAKAVKVPAMGGQSFTPEYGAGRLDLEALLA